MGVKLRQADIREDAAWSLNLVGYARVEHKARGGRSFTLFVFHTRALLVTSGAESAKCANPPRRRQLQVPCTVTNTGAIQIAPAPKVQSVQTTPVQFKSHHSKKLLTVQVRCVNPPRQRQLQVPCAVTITSGMATSVGCRLVPFS